MLIPIYDENPTRTFPYVTLSLIALNALVFWYEITLGVGSPEFNLFISQWAAVPDEIAPAVAGLKLTSHAVASIFTAMFIHAGFIHIAGNMLYLWIFGNNIEDYFGHFKFLLFFLVAGVAGTIGHVFFNLGSMIPSVGASGAIAGVLGAYFVLYPRARVVTLLVVWIVYLPAVAYLAIWIVLQLLPGILSLGAADSGGVAWFAHIGGFASGAAMALVYSRLKRDRD